ncbi:MAG: M48 family metalloprotease [Pseudomonadota bacterium]
MAVCLAGLVLLAQSVQAQTIIRDTEIEETLDDMMTPLLRAAGMPEGAVEIYVLRDPSVNAFVSGGANIFIYTGLIEAMDRVDMLQAVMAHELAHITSGHQARRGINAQNANTASAVGILLGIAAGLAGAPEAGIAVVAGSQRSVQRSFFAYTRSEEAGADQAGFGFMDRAGINPEAMIDVLNLFRGQDLVSERYQDPYARSHPLSSNRISLLEGRIAKARSKGAAPPPDLVDRYARMKGKLDGFLLSPRDVLRRQPRPDSVADQVARAIALHRKPDLEEALSAMDALIAQEPRNPYHYELKGQFLLEDGRPAAAIPYYERALSLKPDAPMISVGLGRSLLALDTPETNARALKILTESRDGAVGTPHAMRALAMAHARAGNEGYAASVTAERMVLARRFSDAERFATQAASLLPNGSPEWIRVQDLLRQIKRRGAQ